MKSFTKYLLLLMALAWSGWMFGQTSPAQTEEQKIALDNASMSTETAIVPFSTYADEPAASRSLMVEIGNGTTYGTSPAYYADWSNFFENCHTQTLYLASELGGGMLITDLQYVFERIATPDNYLLNVEIRFMETTDNQLTTGAFYSTAGSTLVWSSANYVPATATGWADLIDINDYVYTGVNNLIVDILWGDNGYYESPYYRTYRTDGGVPRVLVGYADSETPPNYDNYSNYYSNIRFYGDPLTAPGDIEGHVYNTGGLSIGGATVGIEGYGSTTTDGTGYYFLSGMPSGDQELVCFREGYNVNIANVNVASGGIITHDFTMTSPNLTVSPLRLDETLAPNEYLTRFIGMLNTGSGPVDWTAEVIYPITSQAVTNLEGGEDFTRMTRFDGKFGAGSFLPAAGPAMSDRGTMDCPDNAVFSNPPVGSDNGYTSDATAGWKVYQSFTGVPGSISTVTFWTIFTAAPPATKDYLIEVYEAGATPGALLSTGTYTLTPVNTGVQVIGYDTYVFTAEIPSVAATDGWVMVQGLAGAPTNYWLNTYSGIGTALQSNGGAYTNVGSVAMCLSGGGAGNWLTLGEYDGTVNGGGASYNLAANFDASGTEVGDFYTADIVISTTPDVGTITIPVTMAIAGDPLPTVEDLTAELTNEITGQVTLGWSHTPEAGFLYYRINRNYVPVATSPTTSYIDMLPNYGTFAYTVQAVYTQGSTVPAGPEIVEWNNPTLVVNDVPLYDEVWPDDMGGDVFTISNTGTGTMAFEFPAYVTTSTTARFPGTYQLSMTDDFGDGWNGGTLTLYVAGNVVFNGTMAGAGPVVVDFQVEGGDEITSTFVCGSWCYECEYEIIDTEGNVVWVDGAGGTNPTGIPAGALYAVVPPPGFIVDVQPASGLIPAGGTATIVATFSSLGYPIGTYMEDFELLTNDPDAPSTMIGATMVVYEPASVFGQVVDCNSGLGLEGVTVSAVGTDWTTETDGDGMYELRVDAGTYDIDFFKLGFEGYLEPGVVTVVGAPVELNVSLCEAPYPVQWVIADPNEADTQCLVEWSLPMGPYEIAYDDGTADEYTIWAIAGGAVGVRFTPVGYPATVIGGRLNVGDGSFPAGGDFLGSTMAVGVIDDDGANGMPGTVLDSAVVGVDNYGWVEFYGALNATITDGDFYLVMWQIGLGSNSAPIAIDNEQPIVYRSYAKMPGGAPWAMSPYQDFMIRAYVSGPTESVVTSSQTTTVNLPKIPASAQSMFIASGEPTRISGTVKSGEILPVPNAPVTASRDLTNYVVALVSDFDPDLGPETGTLVPIANPTTTSYNHTAFGGLAPGFYAYAVKAVYESGESIWVYSNVVAHLLDAEITVNVTLCDGEVPEGVEVSLIGSEYPYQNLFDITGTDGTVVFDSVIYGRYELSIYAVGYNPVVFAVTISGDEVFDIILSEKEYMPRNLFVDAQTSVATWDEPIIFALDTETFESPTFPPVGWQALTDGAGWFRSDDGGSAYFPVPAGDGFYAITNDDDAGSTNDGSADYLITPMVDLRESTDFALYFDQVFTMAFGESAYVEYSLDGGATWDILQTMGISADWTEQMVDLSAFSGPGGYSAIWFAFHYDDNGEWAAGWAVDNVAITNGPAEILGYYVFLDGNFVTSTDVDTRTYRYRDLTYGQTYTAGVAALYACGISDMIEYTWTSGYLYPPRNLGDEYVYGTNEIPFMWNPPMTEAGPVMSFNRSTYVPAETSVSNMEGNASSATFNGSRDLWDIFYGFEMDGPSGLTGLAGGETDGEYIYAPRWSGSEIVKFTPDGTFVETFTIPGVSGIRDLAFDGTYMYGAAANTTVWKMDFTNQTLVSTITAPTAVRAIAYDEDADGLWANNWDTDLTLFSMSGAVIDVIAGPPSIYGMAYDGNTADGPYLWLFEGTTSGGGCWVSQWDIAAGAPTGVQHSVSDDFGSDGIAGGLYFDGDITTGFWTLGGTMQGAGDVAFGYDQGVNQGGGGGGDVPDGLVSFILYQDGESIAEVPYEGQGVDEWVTYVVNPINPGDYCYDVSAKYDLTMFGFPGEFGESAWEGTDCVHVVWGFPIPFFEGWDQGTFEFNSWMTDGENWKINPVQGDPEPAAEFTWDPLLEDDYSSSLTSSPITADLLTEGEIWLDFDVKLDDRNSTGLEMLQVEVYNGSSWSVVATFANNGSFDWTSNHVEITNHAMSRVFQVRFNAVGMNSFDVISWFVDNIEVYRTCESISDLAVMEVNLEDAQLSWNAPVEPVIAEWLYYDNGSIEYVWGSTAAWSSDEAIRFEASDLVDFAGAAVTKISVFIDSRLIGVGTVSAKIWQGANAANLIYEEDVTSQIVIGDDFNEVTLATPVPFDNTDELWIGVNTAGPADTYGVGITTDMGTWDPNADLMNNGSGWEHIQDYGISNRAWLLRGFVTTAYQTVALGSYTESTNYIAGANLMATSADVTVSNAPADRMIAGFNVYRKTAETDEYEMYDYVPAEVGVEAYTYLDTETVTGSEYWYQVTCVWESETDYCESAPGYNVPMTEDFVYILILDIENTQSSELSLYPNPASDRVNVTSNVAMNSVSVLNYVGQVVYTAELSGENAIELNTSSYEAGVYVVQITTANGIVTKRVVIAE